MRLACADIAEEVTRHTNTIAELNQLMIRLTTATPYPAHGRMGQVR